MNFDPRRPERKQKYEMQRDDSGVGPAFRTDIHALRGIAVLLVVLYHTQLGFHKAGYLGVDVFFVISGYLITGIIQKEMALGTFSFGQFYLRRARRILPATFTTILFCFAASGFFLTAEVQQKFTETALASVFFISNVSLWLQSDYFSSDATLQPLLHMWSLAIEEQFYLFLPLTLFLAPRRRHFVLVSTLLAASLALCLFLVFTRTSATFYLLPTRAWEMLLGAALATASGRFVQEKPLPSVFGMAGFFIVIIVPIVAPGKQMGWPHPSLDSILVCSAVALVIVSKCPLLDRGFFSRFLGWFGTISFSLYLVHWPVIAFLNNAYMLAPLPYPVRLGTAALSVCLALALLVFVEKPMRYARGITAVYRGAVIFGVAIICIIIGQATRPVVSGGQDFAERLRPNMGLSSECEYPDHFVPKPACQTSDSPEIIVWGDSYAMHLLSGFTVDPATRVIQATKSVCGPFHGIAPLHSDYLRGNRFSDDCFKFNQSVVAYIQAQDSIRTVVLSSLLNQYLFLGFKDQAGNPVDNSVANLIAAIEETATLIRRSGKEVVLFAPPPSEGAGFNATQGYDIGLCLEREMTGKIVAGRAQGCSISEDVYHAGEARLLQVLETLRQRGTVPVLYLDPFLCTGGTCRTSIEGTLIYRDKGHLSYEGARLLGERYDLLGRAVMLAE